MSSVCISTSTCSSMRIAPRTPSCQPQLNLTRSGYAQQEQEFTRASWAAITSSLGKVGKVGPPKPCLHWIAGLCDHQVITARPGYRRCAGCSGDASWGLCTRCRMQVTAPRARMLIGRCYQQGRAARLVRQGQEGQCSPRLPIL